MSNFVPTKQVQQRYEPVVSLEDPRQRGLEEETLAEVWAKSLPLMRPFLRRALRLNQMDFETALDEMVSLVCGNSGRVFKQAFYRSQTKARWARDDPAFFVLQAGFLIVAAVATGVALRARKILTYLYFVFASALLHWLLGGIFASTATSFLANRYLRKKRAETVEWLYAFDVHCNAFFVYFMIAYVLHYFLLPLALGPHFFNLIVANTLHASAVAAYFYVTHIGFCALPFLRHTEVFLYPALAAALFLALSILLALLFRFRINASILAFSALIAPLPYY